MIPDFSSFVQNASSAECCLVYSGHFHVVGSSGRVCRLRGLKDVFHLAWVKIIKCLINFDAYISHVSNFHRDRAASFSDSVK